VRNGEIERVRVAWLAKVRELVLSSGLTDVALISGNEEALGVTEELGEGINVVGTGTTLEVTPPTVVALPLALTLTPNTLSASFTFTHPTKTPSVVFIGSAKHCVPAEQTVVMTKLPAASQFPTFPDMHATCPDVHGDEKFSVEKRLL
jgi:hypothetical protein